MKVVILCGGQGTRIRNVSEDIPKPMIHIGNYPILWHIMKCYAHYGFNDFILCLGYLGEKIRDFFLNYEAQTRDFTIQLGSPGDIQYHTKHNEADWKITLAETGLNAMTGARVKKIQKYIKEDENFMLTYGDGLSNINLKELLHYHKNHGKTLTVTGVRPPGRFGELNYDKAQIITEFNEKPQAIGGRISGGFFVCRDEIFNYIKDQDDCMFEIEPMNHLVKNREMVVYEHNDFWHPMDTPRDYKYLNELVEKGSAPWIKW